MDAAPQSEFFAFVLDECDELGEAGQGNGLVNEVLEVFLDALDGEPELYRYELPKSSPAWQGTTRTPPHAKHSGQGSGPGGSVKDAERARPWAGGRLAGHP